MNLRAWALVLSVVLATVLGMLCPTVFGLINPNFTPIHLVEQSEAILVVKVKAKEVGDRTPLELAGTLKGKAPSAVALDLTAAPKQHLEAARNILQSSAGQPMLLFAGKYEQDEVGYLHARGAWLRLAKGEGGAWKFQKIDDDMQTTWAGGTDMLARCVEYILAYGDEASVPVAAGTQWRGQPQAVASMPASAKGQARSLAVVDLLGDGKICLYVACPEGDRLYRPAAGKDQFEDITAKVRLAAKSIAACWGDYDGDGRADLLSWDGKVLTLWQQAADGGFAPAKVQGDFSIPPDCPGLETVALGDAAGPAVAVGGTAPLTILKPAGRGAFAAVKLAEGKPAGKFQGPIVGDFNGDGLPDIIAPAEKDGLFYAARKGGGFDPPRPCPVGCTVGGGRAVAGDFDGDGLLDVLAAGAEGARLFQNLGDGTFQEALESSGEIAYKSQPLASWCGTCDFNNDGRLDVFLTYANQAALLYFNRGFRSFGQAPKLEQDLGEIPDFGNGQQMGAFADFDGDAAEDFAILMPDGEVFVAYNGLGEDARAIKVLLAGNGACPGPVNVTAWAGKRLLGARQVRGFGPPAFFGLTDAGKYTLKWQFPGQGEQSTAVVVEKGAVQVVLGKDGRPASRPAGGK